MIIHTLTTLICENYSDLLLGNTAAGLCLTVSDTGQSYLIEISFGKCFLHHFTSIKRHKIDRPNPSFDT